MKCAEHNNTDAVATCRCGRGLCSECANRFTDPMCESCVLEDAKSISHELYRGLLITVVVFAAVAWWATQLHSSTGEHLPMANALLMGVLLAFTYWGWRFLTDHLPSLTAGTGIVWVMYLLFKFIAAYCIGLIVGPYQIGKMIWQLRAIHQLKRYIADGRA